MKPRRPFGPRRGPPPHKRGDPFPRRRVPLKLQQAHQLFEQGEYDKAAILFEELGDGAIRRGFHQAPQLYFQAGRSLIMAGVTDEGVLKIQTGLNIFMKQKRWLDLSRTLRRIVRDMQEQGLEEQAEELENWVRDQLPEGAGITRMPRDGSGTDQAKHPKLPLQCPTCGGPVHPGDIEWADSETAVCDYCGNMLRGED